MSYPNARASAQQLHGLMEQWVDASPTLAAEQLRKYIEEQEVRRIRPLSPEERDAAQAVEAMYENIAVTVGDLR